MHTAAHDQSHIVLMSPLCTHRLQSTSLNDGIVSLWVELTAKEDVVSHRGMLNPRFLTIDSLKEGTKKALKPKQHQHTSQTAHLRHQTQASLMSTDKHCSGLPLHFSSEGCYDGGLPGPHPPNHAHQLTLK